MRVLTIYGGTGYDEQLDTLEAGIDIAVGTPGRLVYLNSASDYRAADNVSVALTPRAASRLRALLGNRPINEALVGRAVIVEGRPRRHTMQVLTDERRPTGRGYYQVRIAVDDISRIAIAD